MQRFNSISKFLLYCKGLTLLQRFHFISEALLFGNVLLLFRILYMLQNLLHHFNFNFDFQTGLIYIVFVLKCTAMEYKTKLTRLRMNYFYIHPQQLLYKHGYSRLNVSCNTLH